MNSIIRKSCVAIIAMGLVVFGFSDNCEALSSSKTLATSSLPPALMKMYELNEILWYDASNCVSVGGGGLGSLSGSTFKEKMWCALTTTLGMSKETAAGMLSNSLHESGLAQWEGFWVKDNGTPIGAVRKKQFVPGMTFDKLYNHYYSSDQGPKAWPVGVGMFGFTSGLSEFLHYISDNDPNLIKYFEDPQYSVSSDELLEMIGQSDFDKLLQLELKYFFEVHALNHHKFKMDEFKQINDARRAAEYFAHNYEICAACGYDGGNGQLIARGADAVMLYDEYKDFSCSSSSSTTPSPTETTTEVTTNPATGETIIKETTAPAGADAAESESIVVDSGSGETTETSVTVSSSPSTSSVSTPTSSQPISGSEITWIGDSYSTGARSDIEKKFPGISFGGSVDDANSTIQGCKFVNQNTSCNAKPTNPSGLDVLEKVIKSGDMKPYLVFALGTNGGWDNNSIAKFKELMAQKPETKVILVTSKTPKNDYRDSNTLLKTMADENNNFYLADWVPAYDAKFFTADPDGIHPSTNGGYEKWVEVIANALNGAGVGGCTTSSGNNAIAETALKLAWPERGRENEVYPEFLTAAKALGQSSRSHCPGKSGEVDYAQDCAIFVSVVVRTAGADPNYPHGGTGFILPYMESSPLWEEIENNGNEDNLQPGDIFIVRSGGSGHIFVYVGDGKITSASLCQYTGKVMPVYYSDHRGKYRIFRAKNNPQTSSSCNDEINYCSEDSSSGGATISGEGDQPIGPLRESSENVACDPRTTDIGVYDGYFNYVKTRIRLCALDKPGYQIKSSGAEEGGNYGVGYSGKHAIVNSRVSGSYAGLAARYLADHGNPMQASSSFRSNAHQQILWDQYGHDPARADRPGHSAHQGGLAVDISGIMATCPYKTSPSTCNGKLAISRWLENNLGDFGLTRPNSKEAWHVQTPW